MSPLVSDLGSHCSCRVGSGIAVLQANEGRCFTGHRMRGCLCCSSQIAIKKVLRTRKRHSGEETKKLKNKLVEYGDFSQSHC